ncbi:hypothetical protein QJS04_geneDACA023318 [Acorus gramineus]|uniref:Reverse transcriptase domain-containing protein n=1 Tax=Acorus gramineus TaxID=55184 RepID=A0AAV9BEM5_ACOGR|nr:hypothetical protein QJS04_geneDACA023318 [Acorus gramineus]
MAVLKVSSQLLVDYVWETLPPPLLFVLVMNVLSSMIEEAVSRGKVGRFIHSKLNVSHLCFADDLMIFTDCSHSSAMELRRVLDSFSQASRLFLNHSKSQLFCSSNMDSMSSTLDIPLCSLPVKHLGLPLQTGTLSNSSCLPLIDKVRKRLQSWAGLYLSKAGRLELIHSVISSYSLFWTAGFSLPKKSIRTLEQIARSFLWAGEEGRQKQHAVSWDQICLPKDEGGLGLKRLVDWNSAAMGVQLWELASNLPSIWAVWMKQRYFRKRNIWTSKASSSGSSVWKHILGSASWIRILTKYVIFEGKSINLWSDPWLKGYGLDHFFNSRGRFLWGPPQSTSVGLLIHAGTWVKPPRWPQDLDDLWEEIAQLDVGGEGEDILVWTGNKTGSMSYRSAWNFVRRTKPSLDWTKAIWHSSQPPRWSFLCWQAALNRLPTLDRLWKRHLVPSKRCVLCLTEDETALHLFYSCPFSGLLWRFLSHKLKLNRTGLNSLGELFLWFTSSASSNSGKRIIHFLLAQIFWLIWKARKEQIFKLCSTSSSKVMKCIISCTRSRFAGCKLEKGVLAEELSSLLGLDVECYLPSIQEITWSPPPLGWLKANSDGSKSNDQLRMVPLLEICMVTA